MNRRRTYSAIARALLVACVVSIVATAAQTGKTTKKPPATPVEQADALYAKRADLAHVREAIRILQKSRTADPKDFAVTWRLARANYYLAAHAMDERERDRVFDAGIDAATAAVALEPKRPEGHFWRGANLGGRAKAHGGFSAFRSVDDVRKEMAAVIAAEPGYQGGSAYMVLGQIDLRVPALFGGSKRRALEELEKGLTYGENNLLLRVQLAEAYHAAHRDADARRQLGAVLAAKPDPDYLPEHQEATTDAKRLLDELDAKSAAKPPAKPPAAAAATP